MPSNIGDPPQSPEAVTLGATPVDVSEPSDPTVIPMRIEDIKLAITQRVNDAAAHLEKLRKERDRFNADVKRDRATLERAIKGTVVELAEAKRIANALKPRTRTKKPAAK